MKRIKELEQRKTQLEAIMKKITPIMMEGYSAVPGSQVDRWTQMGQEEKSSFKDLVTHYDKRVEEALLGYLEKSFPGEKFLGEESFAGKDKKVLEQAMSAESEFWVLDPIDGTTNYLRAYPFFCSTVAFVTNENSRLIPQVGAIWNPISQEMFAASRGGGAFLNRQQMKVADIEDPKCALLVTGFASNRSLDSHRPFDLFEKITKQTLGVRRDGSAALDLAYVAAGRLDAYWEYGLSPWDIAAGALMVEEAGGKVTTLGGGEFQLETGEILASNSGLHKWLVDQVKG